MPKCPSAALGFLVAGSVPPIEATFPYGTAFDQIPSRLTARQSIVSISREGVIL